MKSKIGIGIIGCGAISASYFKNLPKFTFIDVKACADINMQAAQNAVIKHNIPKAVTVDELLRDKEIDVVLNITVPNAHYEVAKKCIQAGKSVYNEKPLTVKLEEGRQLLKMAKAKGVLVGCAPDTFMGAGIQTARELVDKGAIGKVLGATAFMMGHGPEAWHPNPFFYYDIGGGPLFDMGPYYLTALVNLIGPIKSVSASAGTTFKIRTAGAEKVKGKKIIVKTPTHIAGTLDFANGAIASVTMSFDVWAHTHSRIELYGTTGSMVVPDPNMFGGVVKVKKMGEKEWSEIQLKRAYSENFRSLGLADMAYTLLKGKKRHYRASGELACHVLDAMSSMLASAKAGKRIIIKSHCKQPKALPAKLKEGQLDS